MNYQVFTKELIARQNLACTLLTSAITGGRLVHAYLMTGRSVDDKWSIAKELAAYLNCERRNQAGLDPRAPAALTCYVAPKTNEPYCQNCKWIFDGKHPKALMVLGPDGSKSGKIPVEKARALSDELSKTSSYVRLVVVETASEAAFHRPCANALLKTIEEPRTDCLFVLFAQSQEEVLPTVVSRCQVIPLANRAQSNLGPLQFDTTSGLQTVVESMADRLRRLPFFSSPCPVPIHRAEPGTTRYTQALTDALELSEHLQKILDDEILAADHTIDCLVELELASLKERVAADLRTFGYMQALFDLADDAKKQLNHFVSKKAAFESFALRWAELRQQLLC